MCGFSADFHIAFLHYIHLHLNRGFTKSILEKHIPIIYPETDLVILFLLLIKHFLYRKC